MARKSDKKEQARILYVQGQTLAAIAERLTMSRRQIGRWKKDDQGTDDDWDLLKAKLNSTEPGPTGLNIVSFDRPRKKPPASDACKAIVMGEYGSVEEQLRAIDEMLGHCRAAARSSEVPNTFGSAVNGFVKLIELRNSLLPLDNKALIRELLKRYRTPREATKALREAGWGSESS